MSELILHHFDWSPYAEKVRILLGIKDLAWRSVQIPMIMPKPDLTALTGGYRKTPVLQAGADIYCDSSCIARELERRYPRPTLFPNGGAGVAYALAAWSDRFFDSGAGLAMGLNDELPTDLVQDRREFFTHMDFTTLRERSPHMFSQVLAHTGLVEEQLSDGREFLEGPHPGLVDAAAYFVLWMARGFIASIGTVLSRYTRVARWEGRVREIGHGRRIETTASDALAEARAATPLPGEGVGADDPLGLQVGQRVTVTPEDYGRVPVGGELVTLRPQEVAIRRRDERAGDVVVHFPRIGYVVAGDS